MKENDTYEMEYICSNCGTHFTKKIDKGFDAQGEGGTCPYCGRKDGWHRPFTNYKPGHNPFKDNNPR